MTFVMYHAFVFCSHDHIMKCTKDIVESAANNICEQVASVLKKSLVSVKVDGVTRFSRSYLGMNVQVS